MRWKKKTKTIDDVSVTKLLDEFVDLDVEDDSRRMDMDDEEYIRMMVEKENDRKLERERRASLSNMQKDIPTSPTEGVEDSTSSLTESMKEVVPFSSEHDWSPDDEAALTEFLKTQDLGRMRTGHAKYLTQKSRLLHRRHQQNIFPHDRFNNGIAYISAPACIISV